MNAEQEPVGFQERKNRSEMARDMLVGVTAAFRLPMPRKPLDSPKRAGKANARGKSGRSIGGRRSQSKGKKRQSNPLAGGFY